MINNPFYGIFFFLKKKKNSNNEFKGRELQKRVISAQRNKTKKNMNTSKHKVGDDPSPI
jgi:hypothetical protein